MIAVADALNTPEATSTLIFVLAGAAGMVYAYMCRWAASTEIISLRQYMFGDTKSVLRAVLVLLSMCIASGGYDVLLAMTAKQIVYTGFGVGLLVPERVEKSYDKE